MKLLGLAKRLAKRAIVSLEYFLSSIMLWLHFVKRVYCISLGYLLHISV